MWRSFFMKLLYKIDNSTKVISINIDNRLTL